MILSVSEACSLVLADKTVLRRAVCGALTSHITMSIEQRVLKKWFPCYLSSSEILLTHKMTTSCIQTVPETSFYLLSRWW